MRPHKIVSDAVKKLNPEVYPSECSERAENPQGAESVKADEVPCKDERELHDQFERWLKVHEKGPIPYVHSRMDRKSTIREGHPDWTILFHGACCVEFKMPGGKPTDEQMKCIVELSKAGIPTRVCYSVIEAIEFVREKLGL